MRFSPPGMPVLIEATCNQVNQYGGYTGMTPVDFAQFVDGIANKVGFPKERLILGGDHLGPLAWAGEPAQNAMEKAKALVQSYVQAGFTKIHLDASVPCSDDRILSVEMIADRTAELAAAAQEVGGNQPIRYIVGTEVPPAGGAKKDENLTTVSNHTLVSHHTLVSTPESASETHAAMERAFYKVGAGAAWEHVIAMVVQPGIEYGDQIVREYNREEAIGLARWIETIPGIVFEAHSTDYQSVNALRWLVEDHFAILKVGPALTFALREAVYALAMIEDELGLFPPLIVSARLLNLLCLPTPCIGKSTIQELLPN